MEFDDVYSYTQKLHSIYIDVDRIKMENKDGEAKLLEDDAEMLSIYVNETKNFRICAHESLNGCGEKSACNLLARYIYFTSLFLLNRDRLFKSRDKTLLELVPAIKGTPFHDRFQVVLRKNGDIILESTKMDDPMYAPPFFRCTLSYYRICMHDFLFMMRMLPFDKIFFEIYRILLLRGTAFSTLLYDNEAGDDTNLLDVPFWTYPILESDPPVASTNIDFNDWLDAITSSIEMRFHVFLHEFKYYVKPGDPKYPAAVDDVSDLCRNYITSKITMDYHEPVIRELYGAHLYNELIYEGERMAYSLKCKLRGGKRIDAREVLKTIRFEDFMHTVKFLAVDIDSCTTNFVLTGHDLPEYISGHFDAMMHLFLADVIIGDGWFDSIFSSFHKVMKHKHIIDRLHTGAIVQMFGTFDYYYNHHIYKCKTGWNAIALWILFNKETDPLCELMWKRLHGYDL